MNLPVFGLYHSAPSSDLVHDLACRLSITPGGNNGLPVGSQAFYFRRIIRLMSRERHLVSFTLDHHSHRAEQVEGKYTSVSRRATIRAKQAD